MEAAPSVSSATTQSARSVSAAGNVTANYTVSISTYNTSPWMVQPVIGDIDVFVITDPATVIEDSYVSG